MNPTKSVAEICELIKEYQLLSSKDLAAMRERWFRPNRKEVDDAAQFCRWLVMNRYLTEFVAKVLSGRKSAQLVLNQYRLLDQIISGPMAGAYLAIDALDRHVAIEVLAAKSAADRVMLAKFQEAARNAMKVDHVNVGRILDTGEAHGFYYLVKEFYEGQTLEEILERRKVLPYQQAARLMALALAGMHVLHAQGVSAGDLTADCLLLTSAGKDSPKQRTVKILHAGVRRRAFDETAIGRSISLVAGGPAELELSASSTFQVSVAGPVDVASDINRLGCVFYRTVTGREPFADNKYLVPTHNATPVCQVNPEVPEMLGQIIDEMIDLKPENRPKKAAHVAKSLRVFLAADEQSREVKAEENLAIAHEGSPAPQPQDAPGEAGDAEDEPAAEDESAAEDEPEARPRPRRRQAVSAEPEGLWAKAGALWEEVKPENRDLVFLAGGAVGILLIVLIIELLIGLRFIYVAGLVTGAAASYFVEIFARWRRAKQVVDEQP